MVTAKFPKQRNREFLQPEQGIFFKEQGISRKQGIPFGTNILTKRDPNSAKPAL
jgi:hypothetical protein